MPKTICIVDDDSFYTEILVNLLTMQGYETISFQSATETLDNVKHGHSNTPIDAFILDVIMPDKDGYWLCEALRQIEIYRKTPILFVSSKSSLEDRMRGYEAGGDDYLTKPVQPEELKVKLDRAIQSTLSNKALAEEIAKARGMVTEALSSASEYEIVVQFMDMSFACLDYQTLARQMIKSTSLLGVQCSTLIRDEGEGIFESSDGVRRAIEVELLELAHQNQPIIAFNNRLIINRPHVSLLVKRLPFEDEPRIERLKEQLGLLVQAANARITAMMTEEKHRQQKNFLVELLVSAEKGFDRLIGETAGHEHAINEIMAEFLISLNEGVLDLALDKDQEAHLKEMFRNNVDKITHMILENRRSIESIQAPFHDLVKKLDQAV